jgi:osmoprotectant transport system permease protein
VSAVAVVATAPLAALVGGGTLGSYILQGLALSDEVRVFAAAVLVALLAILTELGFAWLERRAVSPGQMAPSEALTGPERMGGIGSS